MRDLPSLKEITCCLIFILATLSWCSYDEMQDEIKTAQVMADAKAQARAEHSAQKRAERLRLAQLNELDKTGQYMTSYDHIAQAGARP